MGYLKAQAFTHTLPDINSLKNAIRQEITNVTQDTLHCVMGSVPGRWQQCLDCRGGHLQDVVLKTFGLFVNTRQWLTWPCSVVFIAVYNKRVILLSKWVMLNAAPCRFQRLTSKVCVRVCSHSEVHVIVHLQVRLCSWGSIVCRRWSC